MSEPDTHTPVISVIVPIYNTAPYLKDCISSVLRQTFDSFELILVDDNSTDNCMEICLQACKKDNRIRFIHCPEHNGISHARNQGIEAASGIYLFFMDSDDCLHPQLLEQMLQQAVQTHSDITRVEYVTSHEMDKSAWKKYCSSPYHPKWTVSSGEAVWDLWCKARGRDSVRQTLYNRDSVRNIRFNETISIAEDALFNYEFMTAMPRKYSYSDTPGYYYRMRVDSATRHASLETLLIWTGVKFKIRDWELSAGRTKYATVLERENVLRMSSWIYDNSTNMKAVEAVQKKLKKESHHPLFLNLSLYQKLRVILACYCLPINNLLMTTGRKIKNGRISH